MPYAVLRNLMIIFKFCFLLELFKALFWGIREIKQYTLLTYKSPLDLQQKIKYRIIVDISTQAI